ncbi:DUF6896 domain-containing protein [Nocardia sp. CA-151230]|uniref:DUF6896 domain-containing protein n=1 Tax=Nocardia sp. CA-151230 TaxID=3239982 RepID=UPI003D8ACC7D
MRSELRGRVGADPATARPPIRSVCHARPECVQKTECQYSTDNAGVASSRPKLQISPDDLPVPEVLRRMVVRGEVAWFLFSPQVTWMQVMDAYSKLKAALASDGDLLVISHPGSRSDSSSWLTVRRLISVDEAMRLRDRLEALVAEYRALAHRLAVLYREHIEPAGERGEECPNPLEIDGESWWWHEHGAHCLFADQGDDTDIEIEVNTYHPDKIDPYFLLLYAESTDRYQDIHTACLEGIHDMDRMLNLTAIL